MRKNYIGSYYWCGDDIGLLLDNGIRVKAEANGRWREIRTENELADLAMENGTENITLSYRIPDDKYPLICARERQADREFWQKWDKEAEKHEHFERCGAFDIERENTEGYIYDNEIAPERNFV